MKTIDTEGRKLIVKSRRQLAKKAEWRNAVVRAREPIERLPAGILLEVCENFRGVRVRTLPSACCGTRESPNSKIAEARLEYLGHPAEADGEAVSPWDIADWFRKWSQPAPVPRTADECRANRARITPVRYGKAELQVRGDSHGPWTQVAELATSADEDWWYCTWTTGSSSVDGAKQDGPVCAGIALETVDPKLLRTRRRPWVGAIVRSARQLPARGGLMPAGMFYIVTENYGGLEMRALACRSCHHTHSVRGIRERDVAYIGHVPEERSVHSLHEVASGMLANGQGPEAAPTRWRAVGEDQGAMRRIETRGSAEGWTPVARARRDERRRVSFKDAEGNRLEPGH